MAIPNRTVLARSLSWHISQWLLFLPESIFSNNTLKHNSINYFPFKIIYGRKPAKPPDLYSLIVKQDSLHTSAFVNFKFNCEAAHNQLKAGENLYTIFQINDKVLYLSHNTGTCQVKFDTIWHGPFTIIKKVGIDTYSIKDNKSGTLVNHMHAKYLKLYKSVL